MIDSSSIDTGNRMRDRHLRSRDFFDVKRHPQLRYEAHSISSQDPGRAREGWCHAQSSSMSRSHFAR